jgi:hypothetical protein
MSKTGLKSGYFDIFFACFLSLAHLFFAAFTIAALPAADKTRFFALDRCKNVHESSGENLSPRPNHLRREELEIVARTFSISAAGFPALKRWRLRSSQLG